MATRCTSFMSHTTEVVRTCPLVVTERHKPATASGPPGFRSYLLVWRRLSREHETYAALTTHASPLTVPYSSSITGPRAAGGGGRSFRAPGEIGGSWPLGGIGVPGNGPPWNWPPWNGPPGVCGTGLKGSCSRVPVGIGRWEAVPGTMGGTP